MNDGERRLVEWQGPGKKASGFYNALFRAIAFADAPNMERLAKGFPEEVKAYKDYKNDWGVLDRLQEEYE